MSKKQKAAHEGVATFRFGFVYNDRGDFDLRGHSGSAVVYLVWRIGIYLRTWAPFPMLDFATPIKTAKKVGHASLFFIGLIALSN